MTSRTASWLGFGGTVSRATYTVLGCVLAAVKYNLDRFVASYFFDEYWSPLHYLYPSRQHTLFELTPEEQKFYGVMVALAVPFVYAGIVLTVRRLRSIGLPTWLSLAFFVPAVNFLFFVALCVLPANLRDDPGFAAGRRSTDWIDRLIPNSGIGSASMGLLLTISPALVVLLTGVWGLEQYGWGLFVGVPFWLGLGSVVIYGYHERRGFLACQGVAMLSVALFGGLIFVLALEGVICLAMAAPIGFAIAFIGGTVGYFIQDVAFDNNPSATMLVAVLLAVPLLMGVERVDRTPPPLIEVTTSIEIDAPPTEVWNHVVSFSDLPPPEHPIFATGIAYPTDAKLVGHGEDAVRHCNFSTGAFVEPITAWDAPNRLAFDVRSQPPAMQELTPFDGVSPPHIDNFLVSERGEFRLESLKDDRTRLAGTTWYRHRIWPVSYWRIYSDAIIQYIHRRVLGHIKRQAER